VWLGVALSRCDWSASRRILGRALAAKLAFFIIGVGLFAVFPLVSARALVLAPLALLFAVLDLVLYVVMWLRR
jgi:hypothetical protein